MVKKIIKYAAADGSEWLTKEEAEQRDKKLALFRLLEPIATRGFYMNIHEFFDQNIDAICAVVDSYRELTSTKKKR